MDKLKQWVVLTVVGCLAVLAAGWVLLISPKHAEADDLRTQTTAQESGNANMRTQLAVLRAQAKDLPKKQADLAKVGAQIPGDPALPALVRALNAVSDDAGVELVSILPGPPVPVAPAGTTPAGAAVPATTAAGTAGAGALTSIPLSISATGGYFEVQQFVHGLEGLTRALRVTGLSIAPGVNPVSRTAPVSTEDGRSLTASITAQVFTTGASAAGAPGAAGPTGVAPGVPAGAQPVLPAPPASAAPAH